MLANPDSKEPIYRSRYSGGDLKAVYNRVVKGEYDYTKTAQDMKKKYKDEIISRIDVHRVPLRASPVISAIKKSGLLGWDWSKVEHDKLFHLYIVVSFRGGNKKPLVVEKNNVINITKTIPNNKGRGDEMMTVGDVPDNLKFGDFLDNTEAAMGNYKYFSYHAFNNNCQVYIKKLLRSNGFGTDKTISFIMQTVKEIAGGTQQGLLKVMLDVAGDIDTLKN
jgi:hypothetical protein